MTEEVAGKDDSRDMRSAALFSFVPKLSCYHVHQQLGAQEALTATSAQAQPGHQQHKPAEVGEVLRVAGRKRRLLPTGTLGCWSGGASPVCVKWGYRLLWSQVSKAVVLNLKPAIVSHGAKHCQDRS